MNILVSACLLGVNCRYDGTGQLTEPLLSLLNEHTLIPVCPEQLGGLQIRKRGNSGNGWQN